MKKKQYLLTTISIVFLIVILSCVILIKTVINNRNIDNNDDVMSNNIINNNNNNRILQQQQDELCILTEKPVRRPFPDDNGSTSSITLDMVCQNETIMVYYTNSNDNNEDDRLEDNTIALDVISWLVKLREELQNIQDLTNSNIRDIPNNVTVYIFHLDDYETDYSNNKEDNNNNIIYLDSIRLQSNPNYMQERLYYQLWNINKYSISHGDWVNEGAAISFAYIALSELGYLLRDFEYLRHVKIFMYFDYQKSLFNTNGAVFWLYTAQQIPTENWSIMWNDPLVGEDVFDRIEEAFDYNMSFETHFANFGTANYAHNLNLNNIPDNDRDKYRYEDSEALETLLDNGYPSIEAISEWETTIEIPSFSNRYFEISDPSSNLRISCTQDGFRKYKATYTILTVQNESLVDNDRKEEVYDLDMIFLKDDTVPLNSIVVIVTSLADGFTFQCNNTNISPELIINHPVSLTAVGSAENPKPFFVEFMIKDGSTSNEIVGLDKSDIEITIGSTSVPELNIESILILSYTQNVYKAVVVAPAQVLSTVEGEVLDLNLTIGSLTNSSKGTIIYAKRLPADTMIIIDTSDSMNLSGKLNATKLAASVLVDSFSDGDQVGIVSYGFNTTVEVTLDDFSANRNSSLQAISNLVVGSGVDATIGNALQEALKELDASGIFNHSWNIVLISDGPPDDTGTENFLTNWRDRTLLSCESDTNKAGCRPVVHTVYIGDSQSTNPISDRISSGTGGEYFFAKVPSTTERRLDRIGSVTGGEYFFAQLPDTAQRSFVDAVELADILRSVGERIVDTGKIVSETGLLPCNGNNSTEFSISEVYSNATIVFVWTGAENVTANLVDPSGNDRGPPYFDSLDHKVWRVENVASGIWTINIANDDPSCNPRGSFLVEVAVSSGIFFRVELSSDIPTYITAILVDSTTGALTDENVVANITFPKSNEVTTMVTLHDNGKNEDGKANDGFYGGSFLPSERGIYAVEVSANLDSGPLLKSANSVNDLDDTDKDGLYDITENMKSYWCLDPNKPDAMEDFDDDGMKSFEELNRTTPSERTHPCIPDNILACPRQLSIDVSCDYKISLEYNNPNSIEFKSIQYGRQKEAFDDKKKKDRPHSCSTDNPKCPDNIAYEKGTTYHYSVLFENNNKQKCEKTLKVLLPSMPPCYKIQLDQGRPKTYDSQVEVNFYRTDGMPSDVEMKRVLNDANALKIKNNGWGIYENNKCFSVGGELISKKEVFVQLRKSDEYSEIQSASIERKSDSRNPPTDDQTCAGGPFSFLYRIVRPPGSCETDCQFILVAWINQATRGYQPGFCEKENEGCD